MQHTRPEPDRAAPMRLDFCTFPAEGLRLEGVLPWPEDRPRAPEPVWARLDGAMLAPEAPCAFRMEHHPELPSRQVCAFSFLVPAGRLRPGSLLTFHSALAAQHTRLETGLFFPLAHQLPASYYARQGLHYRLRNGGLLATPGGGLRTLWAELRLLLGCLRFGTDGLKAIVARTLAHLWRPFQKKPTWLFIDRIQKAGDNAEALFDYVCGQENPDILPCFCIQPGTPDGQRLQRKYPGRVLPYLGWKHKVLLLCGCRTLSSQATHTVQELYGEKAFFYADLLQEQRYVYLKHGVTLHNLSSLLFRARKNLSIFCASTRPEYQAVLREDYGYTQAQVKLTGLARFDLLTSAPKREIAILPTWRKYILRKTGNPFDPWHFDESFLASDYYAFYNGLLNHPRLLDALSRHGCRLSFLEHPNAAFAGTTDLFQRNQLTTFVPYDTPHRDILARANLLVTDYSSIAFDFAYLHKPLIYAHFDAEEFFSGKQDYSLGYFQYARDGFGEVECTLEGTVSRILDYMARDFRLKETYRKRIDETFAYLDQHNCARIYQEALRL